MYIYPYDPSQNRYNAQQNIFLVGTYFFLDIENLRIFVSVGSGGPVNEHWANKAWGISCI